jgi:hypothetical protein
MKKPKTLPEADALIASKMRHRHDANRADVYEKFRAIHGADVRESDAQAIISGRGGFSTLGIACQVLAALDEVPAPSAPAASATAAPAIAKADKPWANGLERSQYRVDAAINVMSLAQFKELPVEAQSAYMARGGLLK